VPVDDTHCYWYAIFTSFTGPVDKQQMREQRLELYELPDYTSRKNKRNNYGFSVEEQLTQTYTGMGDDINVHDQWAVESQGPIQNRTREHLGSTDKGIIAYRRMLVRAIESSLAGEGAPMLIDAAQARTLTGPPSIDGIGQAGDTDSYWQSADRERRLESDWASARLSG
jgi:phthalate 4,5-dioxygenase